MATSNPSSQPYYVDALLYPEEPRWNSDSPLGTPVTVSYSFMTSLPTYYDADPNGIWNLTEEQASDFIPFSFAQSQAARQVLSLWEEVSGLSFIEDTTGNGQIRFGSAANSAGSSTRGWAYPPEELTGGDVWLNHNNPDNNNPTPGSPGFKTLIHELGHALGLKHPFDHSPTLTGTEDSRQYTNMAYNGHPTMGSTRDIVGTEPLNPLLYDIAAIQYLYGANTNTRSGPDTYQWDADKSFIQAIWDTGGIDTISAANQTLDAQIDLRAGFFSSIGRRRETDSSRATDNLAIAYGVTIENAIGGSGNDNIIGNSNRNDLRGGSGDDKIDGQSGSDSIYGEDGNDILIGGDRGGGVFNFPISLTSASDHLHGGAGDDYLYGGNGESVFWNDFLYGEDGNDHLFGEDGIDILNGGAGDDYLSGGNDVDFLNGADGNDVYIVDSIYDSVIEYDVPNSGIDIVNSSVDFTLGNGLENLSLIGDSNINGAGNNLDNTITGNIGNNSLYGWAGNDTIIGSVGNDSLFGGLGDDKYYIDSNSSRVIESVNEGIDTVYASINYTLSSNVENLVLVDGEPINGYGNSLDNLITGNNTNNLLYGFEGRDTLTGGAGEDVLDGGLGSDSMFGGQGDDNYYVDNINDTVTEYINQGIDTVYSSVSYTQPDNVEYLFLTGNEAIDVIGNSAANNLTGNEAANTLDGRAGDDTLYGNAGNDSIFGGEGDDKLNGGTGADVLNGGTGVDTVSYLTASTGITANLTSSRGMGGDAAGDIFQSIENLEGSEYSDRLVADNSNNTLAGLGGDDYLDGRGGNDILHGGDGSDRLQGAIGNDLLYGEIGDDALNGNTGDDFLDGGDGNDDLWGDEGNDSLYGQAGDDALTGDDGSDLLYGGLGSDVLEGQLGNDQLYGGEDADFLLGGEGDDFLYSDAGDDNLDGGNGNDLLSAGLGDDFLYGAEGNDQLAGESGSDYLEGGLGNDQISGGSGDDFLVGGGDRDTFLVRSGDGIEAIADFGGIGVGIRPAQTKVSEADTIRFEGTGLTAQNMLLTQQADDLVITFAGNDSIKVILQNFELQELDNLSKATGSAIDASNILFDGQNKIQDSFDVFDANKQPDQLLNKNTVSFLNDLDNNIKGFNRSNDVINGQGGNDILNGLSGDDLLRGGDGNDVLIGGSGQDILVGGSGSDTFVLKHNEGADIINQFEGIDFINLEGDLTLDQLLIGQGTGANANDTLISINNTGELLATLTGIQANTLTLANFT